MLPALLKIFNELSGMENSPVIAIKPVDNGFIVVGSGPQKPINLPTGGDLPGDMPVATGFPALMMPERNERVYYTIDETLAAVQSYLESIKAERDAAKNAGGKSP